MKIIKITTLTILIAGAAQADYSAKIPLESTAGGSLPNGSIKFTNNQPTLPSENWIATAPIYTEWVNYGSLFNCTNWTPDPSTVALGETFTQTATDCEQQQTRTKQDREQETTTLVYRNVGGLITENQILTNQINTRNAVGTKETWIATTPVYTSWVNSGGIYGCSNWSPETSTVTSGQPFTQTATDCKQDQTRTRQEREQEITTLTIRDVGAAVTENQTIEGQTSTRAATGSKAAKECSGNWRFNSDNTVDITWYNLEPFQIIPIASRISYRTTHSTGGYKYTLGTYFGESVCGMIDNSPVYCQSYEACREPI